uniref:Uncharacterized protein n=1 Tax=mine drainage metagenome TaxID=410659 RepID=E6QHN7_9ZZZZ
MWRALCHVLSRGLPYFRTQSVGIVDYGVFFVQSALSSEESPCRFPPPEPPLRLDINLARC